MEIPESIITDAWSQKNLQPLEPGIKKILTKLSTLSIKKFFDKKTKSLYTWDRKIHQLHSVWMCSTESVKITQLRGFIAAMQNCLNHAFKNTDLPSLLSFIMVQSYFPVQFERFVDEGNYSQDQKDALAKQIEQLLNQLKIDFNSLKNLSYFEEDILKKGREAETEGDIQSYYRLITSIERSTGLISNPLASRLSLFYYYLNTTEFTNFLSRINKPLNIIFYLNKFSKAELVNLAGKVEYGYWFNIEIVRKLVSWGQKNHSPTEQNAVKQQLSVIFKNNSELFKKVIRYFADSELAMRAFGDIGKHLPTVFIETVFKECFTLTEYDNRINIHQALLDVLRNTMQLADFKVVLATIYNIWNDYVQSLLQKDNFIRFMPLLTDFAPYVAAHYQYNYSDKEIIDNMNKNIDDIMYIESEWHVSISKAITKNNWYGSSLYIFSVAYTNKGIKDATIKNKIEQLIKNEFYIARYKTISNKLAIEMAWNTINNCT